MKSKKQALEIAVIGLGQAGGNIASEFFVRGYRALAFNTGATDLTALSEGGVYPALPGDCQVYIGVNGHDGAGADPANGKHCIQANADRIREAVAHEANGADLLLVTAGLGGGTGSALSEMIRVIKDVEVPILTLMTLPSDSESGLAKVNAVRAVNELINAPIAGRIFIDNARIASLHPDVPIVEYFPRINSQLASPIDALNCLNGRSDLTPIRSFDGEDYRRLLLSGGALNFGVADLPQISVEEVLTAIRRCVESSDLMPNGFDLAQLSFVGVVIEAGQKVLSSTPISVLQEVERQLKVMTGGAAVYYGVYRSNQDGPCTLRMLAATQSLPERIRTLLATAKREGNVIGEKVRAEITPLELGEVESLELFRSRPPARSARPHKVEQEEPTHVSARENANVNGVKPIEVHAVLSERNLHPSSPSVRRPRPELKPKRVVDIGDAQDATVETDSRAEREEHETPAPEVQELASPEVYERMVKEYQQAKGQRARDEVARRLREDSKSNQSMVRYYAVEAMCKLGREAFRVALLAATQDESEPVRALAIRALR